MGRAKITPDARGRLIETADRLFYAEGIRAVGIDRIIAEAGVAKATLYAHFSSKDDLILAVLQYREGTATAFFQEAMDRHAAETTDRLDAFFAALKDWFAVPGFRGCAFQNAAVELADRTHPGFAFARDHKQRFHAFLAALIRDAVGKPGALVAPAVAVLVEGAIVMAVIEGSVAPADVARDAARKLVAGAVGRR